MSPSFPRSWAWIKSGHAISRWPLWSQPPQVLAAILAVHALAVVLTAATASMVPFGQTDWAAAAVLGAGSIVHLEVAKGIERLRETMRADAPFVDLKSVWTFAGVLLLPPPLAVALVVLTHTHMRVRRLLVAHTPIFRSAYTAATVVLATNAVVVVLHVGLTPAVYPGLPHGWRGLAVVVLAMLTRWFINHGLIVMIILLSSPQTPGMTALGSVGGYATELAGVSLGAVTAVMVATDPWYLLLIMPPLLLLHRSLLLHHYELAARTDEKTRLVNVMHWSEVARRELSRAARDRTPVGVLMIDLDHFKRVNDTHGHLAGDAVLKAVADAIRRESRDYDLAGRFGGEEFVLLLPGLSQENLLTRAERLRHRISDLTVHTIDNHHCRVEITGLTASIGAATYPSDGAHLDTLLLAVDAALYEAKRAGRDRTCLAHRPRANGTGTVKGAGGTVPQARNPEQTGHG